MPTRRRIAKKVCEKPTIKESRSEAERRALSTVMDRVIKRNLELVKEVTALKRRITVLERRLAADPRSRS